MVTRDLRGASVPELNAAPGSVWQHLEAQFGRPARAPWGGFLHLSRAAISLGFFFTKIKGFPVFSVRASQSVDVGVNERHVVL